MKKPGFTLIELIVSTSIIGLVTGLFLANYSSANRRTDLVMTAQKVVADIHLAQNYALGLARYGTSTDTYVPAGGWGVRFDLGNLGNNQYVIFADKDGNKKYDSGEAVEGFGAQANYLPDNIKIQSLSVSPANITFLPPDPITTISNGTASNNTSVDIVLNDIKTNATKTIRVNFLGLVEVID